MIMCTSFRLQKIKPCEGKRPVILLQAQSTDTRTSAAVLNREIMGASYFTPSGKQYALYSRTLIRQRFLENDNNAR
jgi:hypothetical protein